MAAVGLLGWKYNDSMEAGFGRLYKDSVQGTVQLAKAESALWQLRYGFPQFLVLDADARAKIVADEPKWYKAIEHALEAYAERNRTAEERQALKEWSEVFTKYREARPKWFELVATNKMQEAADLRSLR